MPELDRLCQGAKGTVSLWLTLVLMAEEVAIGIASYLVVVLLHRTAIRRVPLALALKVTE